jgi:hypothetical protein
MEWIKESLTSPKWWAMTGLAMLAGWGLAFAVGRLVVSDIGALSTLLIGAPGAFVGALAQSAPWMRVGK